MGKKITVFYANSCCNIHVILLTIYVAYDIAGNGRACVEVRANRFCTDGFHIDIPIPWSNGQPKLIQIIVPRLLGKCIAVMVNAPRCPGNQTRK